MREYTMNEVPHGYQSHPSSRYKIIKNLTFREISVKKSVLEIWFRENCIFFIVNYHFPIIICQLTQLNRLFSFFL